MKRFLNFLLFLLLLALAVASVQVWSDRRQGVYYGWRRSVLELLDGERGLRRPEKYTVAEGPRVNLKGRGCARRAEPSTRAAGAGGRAVSG